MKERINVQDYANLITKALPRGILLNTNGDKFNAMVIGWGAHRHPVEQADLPRLCAPGTIHKETAGHDRRFHDQRTVGWG